MSDDIQKEAADAAEESEKEKEEVEATSTAEETPTAEAEAKPEAAAEEADKPEAAAAPEEKKPVEKEASEGDEDAKPAATGDAAAAPEASEEKSALLRQAEERLGEMDEAQAGPELIEKVVHINRCAKVVKGGRRFSFSALVVCGDQAGQVGFGFGKANGVAECIQKASESSKQDMLKVNIVGTTIPHEVIGEFGGGRVLLRPASPGTGIIAGGGVRAVIEASGIKDVLAKSLGSNNHFNVVKATLDALQNLRTREQIYALRGKKVRDKASI